MAVKERERRERARNRNRERVDREVDRDRDRADKGMRKDERWTHRQIHPEKREDPKYCVIRDSQPRKRGKSIASRTCHFGHGAKHVFAEGA